jgi:hypothetical protein
MEYDFPTSSSPPSPGAVKENNCSYIFITYYYSNRVENMIKVTDRNELENLAEFYIFIWGTAPGGDEDTWAITLYSDRMQIQNEKRFSDSYDESRLFYLFSKTFSVK